ncbi:MAG: hypothetical protein IKY43_06415 [Bacteroidales bacterium]|jgi:hypothetical protein|nr:hypothetical protein [Bacteroidales bacterium]
MKKVAIILVSILSIVSVEAQNISQRARSLRMESYAKDEYQVKDIKIFDDTMIVICRSEYVHYPLGKYNSVDAYVNRSRMDWYREMSYRNFFNDSLRVPVTRVHRLDGSFIDTYSSMNTGKMEIIGGHITDSEILIRQKVRVGVKKTDVYSAFFRAVPRTYIADINVLRIESAGGEFAQLFTFKRGVLVSIDFLTSYRYY